MSCPRFQKDPSDKRIITGDFSDWLNGAEIASAAWTVPSALSAANDSITAETATNYFSGGVAGSEYTIKVTITTSEPIARIKSHSFMLEVQSNCDC